MTLRKTPPVKLEARKTGGRGRVAINKKVLKNLAGIGASQEQIVDGLIAAGCRLEIRTLKRRLQEPEFRSIYEAGLNKMKMGLRRTQLKQSEMMNSAGVSMAIHLGKHFLGQTDKSLLELTGKGGGPVQTMDLSKLTNEQIDQLEGHAAALAAALATAGIDPSGNPGGEGPPGAATPAATRA